MQIPRTIRFLMVFAPMLGLGRPAAGQVVSGHTLTGDWVRIDSNNDPNDLMRITIGGTSGVLTYVPVPARPHWKVGQALWQKIQSNGSLEVKGSDGNYYPATMKLTNVDEIRLAIHYPGGTAGDDQLWRRAGADLSGDWVRVAPPGTPGDGTRIRVQGVDATVRYLTATAPRQLRVGTLIWQTIGASGGLDALGTDRKFHPATWTLLAPDRLQVDAPAIAGGGGQLWVRPGSVAAARVAVQPPPPNPKQPGTNLTPTTPLPTPPTPPTTPPRPPATSVACLGTSLPHDATDVQWGLSIYKAGTNVAVEEALGIRPFLTGGLGSSGAGGNAPADLDRILLPGLQDGFVDLWERRPSRRSTWRRNTGMTGAVLDQEIQNAQANGERPTDVEGFLQGSTTFYAGVWEANREGIDWKLEYDLTSQAFGSAFQNYSNNGYRLVDMEAYQTSAGLRYAAIWWASCDASNWKEVRDMDFNAFDARFRAERAQGFQVVDFESYTTPSGQRYAAIWQQMPPDRDWEVRIDLDMKWFLNALHRYADLGLRLIDFESYDTPSGVRYAGVWAENDARHDYAMVPVLDTAIANYRQTHLVPGISVVIMQDGEVVYRRGFGWADSAEAKQAHAGTVYMTASVAKAIGATLAAKIQLQRDANGRPLIDLSQPTSTYVTVPSTHTHTLEQLLRKHGCIWHYGEGPQPTETYYPWQAQPVDSMQGPMISRVLSNGTTLNCVPGQFYHYSTHGFTFVGAALEKVTGKNLTTLIQDEIAAPFSLSSLRVAAPKIPVAVGPGGSWIDRYEMAQAYGFNGTTNRIEEVQYEESSWKILGGGLQANALDLAQFGWLTLDGKIAGNPDTELWQGVTAPASWVIPNRNPPPATRPEPNPTVGLAWVLRTLNATSGSGALPLRRIAEHGGIARGARTQLQIYREAGCRMASGGYGSCASNPGQPRQLVVAIMSNSRFSPVTSNNAGPIQALADSLGAIALRNPPW